MTPAGAGIDQAVQPLPAFSSQAADPAFCRCQRQRNHQREARQPSRDEAALSDIVEHFVNVEEFIEPDVSEEVQAAVEEGEESEHAAEVDEPVLARELAQWRDGKRDEKEGKSPIAGRVRDDFDGVGSKQAVEAFPRQPRERNQRGQEENRFEVARLH